MTPAPLLSEEVGPHLAETVGSLVLLLLIVSVVAMLIRRTPIPFSVALVATGLAVQQLPMAHALGQFRLSPEAILVIFLPTLVFAAAFEIDGRRFLEALLPILVLAVPGVLLCAAVVAGVLVLGAGFALPVALLFGAIVSATDPVAVLALFRELGVSRRLSMLMDGESLLNDGTALVLFQTLLGIVLVGQAITPPTLLLAVWQFVLVAIGGAVVGAVLAWLTTLLLQRTNSAPVEITLALILAYGAFILADHYLHVSGVIATISAGLVLGNAGRTKITPTSQEAVEAFWSYAGFAAESLLFILVGLTVSLAAVFANWGLLLWAVVAVLASRMATVYGLVPLINLGQKEKVDWRFQTVMFWGGLRGAVAIAIALGLPESFPEKDLLVSLTLGVVLFTLFINAFTVRPLVVRLGLDRLSPDELLQRRAGMLVARSRAAATVKRLAEEGLLSEKIGEVLEARYGLEAGAVRPIDDERVALDDERLYRVVRQHCLLVERREYEHDFADGDIDEATLIDLLAQVEDELDALRGGGSLAGWRAGIDSALRPIRNVLANTASLQPWLSRIGAQRVLRVYESGRAQLLAFRAVEEAIDDLAAAEAIPRPILEAVRTSYGERRAAIEHQLEEIGDQFPEFAEQVQELIASRFRLAAEASAFRDLHEAGLVSEKILNEVEEEIHEQAAALRRARPAEALRHPEELVRAVPFFADLSDDVVRKIAAMLIPRVYLDGDEIMREGVAGDALYFIGRGVVEVSAAGPTDKPVRLATLRAGQVVGEMALLTARPRSATATAVTPCNLLQLRRRDLEVLLRATPELRTVLEDAYKERVGTLIMAHVPALAGLSQEEREEIAALLAPLAMAGGQELEVVPGAGAVFVVRSGEVEVDAEDHSRRSYREGEGFGEALNATARPTRVRSLADAQLLVLETLPERVNAATAVAAAGSSSSS
jgi:CPA1 family monovalent cation:H+ antiporter